tara:strand:- start:24566 stop:25633 length:1068 start_codon:yes stop_codon:yes gene_type:complete
LNNADLSAACGRKTAKARGNYFLSDVSHFNSNLANYIGVTLDTGVCLSNDVLLNEDLNTNNSLIPVRYKMLGPSEAPLVAVLGGISATADVSKLQNGAPGWWSWLVGEGKVIDSKCYRILSLDYLSDPTGKTVSTFDQAIIIKRILDQHQLPQINAFIGASYGGMVGLSFASLFPSKIGKLISISASHKNSPNSIALRTLQRKIVKALSRTGNKKLGLSLARSLAMLTYRTQEEMNERFDAPPTDIEDQDSFPIWNYLEYHGDKYSQSVTAEHFLSLSTSIDTHFVDPSKIVIPLTVVASNQDQLVPINYCEELVAKACGPSRLLRIDSIYGHDAFLKEETQIGKIIKEQLGEIQ